MRCTGFPLVLFLVLLFAGVVAVQGQDSKENADFKLAINLYNDGLYDLAAEQLRQFVSAFPSAPQAIEARFYLGLAQLKLKRYDDARLTFQTFALTYQDNPKAPEAWWNVGETYVAARNMKEAALAFERVKVFHPKSKLAPDALVRASTCFRLAGEPDNARRVLRIVMQEYPASSAVIAARTALGELYYEEGNLQQAQTELKRVIEGDPSSEARAQALLILGNIYQASGHSAQALGNYQEIITKYATSPARNGAYLNLGKLQMALGKFVEAIDNFKKVVPEQTDSSLHRDALIATGDAYSSLNDFSNAIGSYEKFIALYPSEPRVPEVLWAIATAARGMRDYVRSNAACSRLLQTEAQDRLKRRAQIRLALNAEDQNNPAQAIQQYNSFLDQHGDDPEADQVVLRIAQLSERSAKDLRKAASFYELLETRYPRSPLADDAYAGAARCYDQLKESNTAIQFYRDLIDRFPSSPLRPLAEERVLMIETFEAKDKDAGLEKLALLIGDMVTNSDKSGLAFKLGEIYFHDLKNYSAAAAQFASVISSGTADNRFADALFLRSKSYEYLSWKDESYRTKAIDSYTTYLRSYPAEPSSEEAALALFNLNATSPALARRAYASAVSVYPRMKGRDEALLRLAKLLEAADSLAPALVVYSGVVREFPASASAGQAQARSVMILMTLGNPDSAIASGNRYLAAYPNGRNTAAVLTLLGDAYLQPASPSKQPRDPSRAADLYKKLIDGFSYAVSLPEVKPKYADALVENGQPAEAVPIYAGLIRQESSGLFSNDSPDPGLLLATARAQRGAGDTANARKSLMRLLEQERTGEVAGQALTMLGLIARDEGATDLAASYFRRAGEASPSAAVSRDIAELLFSNGEYTDAIKQYTQLSAAATSETDRQYFDAKAIVARLRNDDLTNAEKEIAAFDKKYKKNDNDLALFELEKGNYYFRRRDYTSARKSFERVAGKYDDTPSAPDAMYWIGKILEATNRTQDAIKQFESLMKQYPKAPVLARAYLSLGNIYYNAEKWDESVKNYRRIVDDPNADTSLLPFAMSNLIETYEAAGVFDAALSLTRRYLEAYPNSDDALDKKIKIGILYQRLGYYDQSIMHLQTLLDQAGSDLEGELRYYIAEANFYKGDYQQAILDFLKVPYLVTKKGKIDWTANSLYMSGQSYEKMGRYDQALTMYQQIVERPGIDGAFKAAAQKEIDRVKLVLKKSN